MSADKKEQDMTELHQVVEGGAYEVKDGVIVRTEEPTHPGDSLGSARADGGPGAAVGTASGEPPRPPEATADAAAPTKRARAGQA